MAVDVARTQDVYKDAGEAVDFILLKLKRQNKEAEKKSLPIWQTVFKLLSGP